MYGLKSGKGLSPKSKMLPFHPYLDQQGLLCFGGQLQRAAVPFTERHPVLLPGSHRVAELVIVAEHLRLLHDGPT